MAAVGAREADALAALLHPSAALRAIVPSGLREAAGADGVAARYGAWFGDAARLDVVQSRVERIGHRVLATYRLRVEYEDGEAEIVEQHAFLDVEDGRVRAVDLVCSGFMPELRAGDGPRVHEFDAGDLGCSSGLPQEVRRRLQGIERGSTLRVTTADASAREDLPALARLLGHEVAAVERDGGGRTIITITRRA